MHAASGNHPVIACDLGDGGSEIPQCVSSSDRCARRSVSNEEAELKLAAGFALERLVQVQ
jgi:hypothetical protein